MQHPKWSYDAVIYEMNVRQLTPDGTFRAAMPHLELLAATGVNAVWLMPIYPIGVEARKGSLGSYYSIRDYCAVNPEFGTMEEFDDFVAEAHRLGLKVLLDWVANHTARDARWLAEKPTNWYERDANGAAKVPWDWSDTAQLNYENREVWQGQIDAMRFWLEKHAIDGFRCDMAMLVPTAFWQEVRRQLQVVNPELFMLAEAEGVEFFDNAFDACYGWELHHTLCHIAQGRSRVDALRAVLRGVSECYPRSAMFLSFTSNHDENSWSGSEFERLGAAAEVMAAMTFLLPGTLPLIYTGQEYGYDHTFAFFDRDPLPRFEAGRHLDFYRKMCAMKHSFTALRAAEQGGAFIELQNNASDCLFTFVREADGARLVVEANLSPYKVFRDYHTGAYAGEYKDVMSGDTVTLYEHEWGDIEPWSYRILAQ